MFLLFQDNTEEKIDQVKKISTRQAAKNKTIKTVVEESFESSPRTTRQKKGSFNRYGSEFVTELKKGPGKTVLFEENVIEKDNREEIKETLRRSKRTRK